MENKKSTFWGIFLLVAAAFIIAGNLGVFGDISVWTVGFSVVLAAWFITSLFKLSFGGMLFSLAFAAMLFDETLGIEAITPWPVLCAALLGTIGLNMIFRKKKKDKFFGVKMGHGINGQIVDEQFVDDEMFKCESAFGSSVKYVSSCALRHAKLESSFGSLTVYFDEAKLGNDPVNIYVENSFGKMVLYVPKEWNTDVNVDRAFGSFNENGRPTREDSKKVYIQGESNFGQLEINYI